MRADFDSEANALSIDLIKFDLFERQEPVHDTYCHVLDDRALLAAAQAALAAPDRIVDLEVSAQVAA